MDDNVTQFNRRINYLIEETDAVYHEIAVRLGLSDSVMLILYALEDAGGQIPLTTIYRQTGASKQTVNSALPETGGRQPILLRMADRKQDRLPDRIREDLCCADGRKASGGRTKSTARGRRKTSRPISD